MLEKEAIAKGVPIGQDYDIEIPPPRPKRKPSNPYPRKTSVGDPTLQVGVKDGKISNLVSSACWDIASLDLEKEPEKSCNDGKLGNALYHEKDNCSEVFTLLETAPCASPSSVDKNALPVSVAPGNSCTYRECIPHSKEAINQDEITESHVTIIAKGFQTSKYDNKQLFEDNGSFNTSHVVNSNLLDEKSLHGERIDMRKQSTSVDTFVTSDVQSSQNYPRHVPVHVLDGNLGMSAQSISPDMLNAEFMFDQMCGVHGHQQLFMNPAASATSQHHCNESRSSIHQSVSSYHPTFTPLQNQDDFHYFLHISSMLSSLIVSALLQNPAAHAAASFTASLWPSVNMETQEQTPTGIAGAFQSRQINAAPSVAAIAAATVAAATAWWSAHGLLPVSAPFFPGFTCSPASVSANPTPSSQGRAAVNLERRENSPDPDPALGGQQLEPECSEALLEPNSDSTPPTLLSSDSEASEVATLKSGLTTAAETAQVADAAEQHDANKSKNRKQLDRSSCGSNTPSSSEVEAYALEKHMKGKEEKHIKDKDESKELDVIHPLGDPFNRRFRSTTNIDDSWKEVSEEGRLAFQALFSREVLPQSFSPPHDLKNKGQKNTDKATDSEKDDGLKLNLNGTALDRYSQRQGVQDNAPSVGENERLLNMGFGHAKIKTYRTGFKPYKRCSMEAKESRVSVNGQEEEKGPKRLRREEEAST
ncbi:hypothetical protein BUALT_Bualt01G0246300 [Buddleja alternifolia]|uniref:Protein LHY n=1 Tax=Buddleja alternifolia TaxID=168488 RepID=A0AAV6YHI3_9LAMI|nr:hypothetical protein BUALT_Bualt01G0246300 [Buddleja alternifolia]